MSPAVQRRDAERARVLSRLPVLRELAREHLPAAADRTVCLVGCGKAKGDAVAPVRELYTSPLFRKSLELAELVGDVTYVASARHGLLALDERIAPYETTIKGRKAAAIFAARVVGDLEALVLGSATRLRVVLFMGATYADPIVTEIEERRAHGSPRWSAPVVLMRGLEVGERLAFLNRGIVLARGAR